VQRVARLKDIREARQKAQKDSIQMHWKIEIIGKST
jgi:hypothetical protein